MVYFQYEVCRALLRVTDVQEAPITSGPLLYQHLLPAPLRSLRAGKLQVVCYVNRDQNRKKSQASGYLFHLYLHPEPTGWGLRKGDCAGRVGRL